MTKRLILSRHAKSSWDDPLMSDHDRPLNARGRASAPAVGRWLARKGYIPDEVLVSSAERTRETWKLIARAAGFDTEADISSALYLAEPDLMLNLLKSATGDTIMMVGHNPGSSFLAQSILKTPPKQHLYDRFPTGATAVIEFPGLEDWSKLLWRQGELVDFAVPRDLIAEEEAAQQEGATEAAPVQDELSA